MSNDYNYLSANGYRLLIDDSKYRDLEYQITEASLPSVTFGESPTPHRNQEGYVPGDTIIYDPISLTFIIDEKLRSYTTILDWMVECRDQGVTAVKDIELLLFTNHNNPRTRIRFTRAFPTSLSEILFTSTTSDTQYLTASATFRYDYYKVEKQDV